MVLKAWILAARPKTLPAAVVPVVVGSWGLLPLAPDARFSPLLFASTLLSCLCIQVATNLFNDAIDFDKGADTDQRLGPRRVTASGLLSRRAVFGGALGFCLAATAIATPIIAARGWPIVAIGSASLLLAWAYTGGPVPLAYRGLGELFVILFFGLVAVSGSWFVQTGVAPDALVMLSGLQIGLLSSVLIAINNLRDIDEDRGTDKRTLAVRFGPRFARTEIAAFALAPAILGIGWWRAGFPNAFLLPLLSLPLAGWVCWKVARTPASQAFNRYLALGALLLLLFAALFTIGMHAGEGGG